MAASPQQFASELPLAALALAGFARDPLLSHAPQVCLRKQLAAAPGPRPGLWVLMLKPCRFCMIAVKPLRVAGGPRREEKELSFASCSRTKGVQLACHSLPRPQPPV